MRLARLVLVALVVLGYLVYVAGILMQYSIETLVNQPPVGALAGATLGLMLVLLGIELVLVLASRLT